MNSESEGEREFASFDLHPRFWEVGDPQCPQCRGTGKVTATLPPGEAPRRDEAGHLITTTELPCDCKGARK